MIFKKSFTALLIFALMIIINFISVHQIFQEKEVVEEIIIPNEVSQTRYTLLLDVKVKSNDFDDNFWIDNSDGKTLNISLKNNGSNPVQHRITHGKNTVRSKGTIRPGKTVQLQLGDDRSGRWRIDVYTTDGSKMNVKVKAKQF
ncbi:MAG: hypothetical protein N4A48_12995 [Tepidibacter sp.]|jgi:hypothetical protein|uniref:hypothetical protein n=1 Tax=Tepidibacter sp. TaxID=2529387 RepID=UPI0026007F1E|nr:hypothetical protein [Tepidibacter sp.]MCT4509647.1 hypothetical protein [Tepidibacter sp.]